MCACCSDHLLHRCPLRLMDMLSQCLTGMADLRRYGKQKQFYEMVEIKAHRIHGNQNTKCKHGDECTHPLHDSAATNRRMQCNDAQVLRATCNHISKNQTANDTKKLAGRTHQQLCIIGASGRIAVIHDVCMLLWSCAAPLTPQNGGYANHDMTKNVAIPRNVRTAAMA